MAWSLMVHEVIISIPEIYEIALTFLQ